MPELLREPNEGLDQYFRIRLGDLRRENEGDEQSLTAEEEAILQSGLSPFDTFVELITHVRQKHHLVYLTQMMDKLLQKNSDFGSLIQGKSVNNLRRWSLGGRLLEVFVQLAVLRWEDRGPTKRFSTEPILIDDFLRLGGSPLRLHRGHRRASARAVARSRSTNTGHTGRTSAL